MTINADPKKAKAVEDFQLDWSVNIGTDTITASAWTVPPGLTAASQSFTGTTARVRLSGGVVGKGYTVSNAVTLASGQVKVQDIYIPIC